MTLNAIFYFKITMQVTDLKVLKFEKKQFFFG